MNIGLSAVNARMIICILSMIMPGILVIITGSKLPSLSEYYYTPIGPFFVGVLSLVAYLLFTMPKWIPSAVLLCGVILFPNHAYPYIHNISAVLFFVTAALAILFERKFIKIILNMAM